MIDLKETLTLLTRGMFISQSLIRVVNGKSFFFDKIDSVIFFLL